MHELLHVLEHTLLDSIKILPFLLIAYLIMEFIEHKTTDKTRNAIKKSGKFGPFIGSLLGAFPQCGFSVTATNLYAGRVITLGTLFAIYLSTSDEMIPILIANNSSVNSIIKILPHLPEILFRSIVRRFFKGGVRENVKFAIFP